MFWLTMTHTQRWRTAHHTVGLGPLYQGRFKVFPVQSDDRYDRAHPEQRIKGALDSQSGKSPLSELSERLKHIVRHNGSLVDSGMRGYAEATD